MDTTLFIDAVLKAAARCLASAGPETPPEKACDEYNEEFFEAWAETALPMEEADTDGPSETELAAFEAHVLQCSYCLNRTAAALDRQRRIQNNPVFSELGQRRMQHRLDAYLSRGEAAEEPADRVLAASEPRRDRTGRALAVAVDRRSGTGTLLECDARVSEITAGQGFLEIRGVDQQGESHKGHVIYTSSPLDQLEGQLEDLFENEPILLPFQLHRRRIKVDVLPSETNFEGAPLVEVQSLPLAIVTAILTALTGDILPEGLVFSAGIRSDGSLRRVGDLPLKLKVILGAGKTEVILPIANREDFLEEADSAWRPKIRWLPDLTAVMEELDLVPPADRRAERAPDSAAESRDKAIDVAFAGDDDRDFLLAAARKAGFDPRQVLSLSELTEDLSQMRSAAGPGSSTCLLMGRPEAVRPMFDLAPVQIGAESARVGMRDRIRMLTPWVDGVACGFLITPQGGLDGILTLVPGITVAHSAGHLLPEASKGWASASRTADMIVFSVSPQHRRVLVYFGGRFIGGYFQGVWRGFAGAALGTALNGMAREFSVEGSAAEVVCRSAVGLAQQMLPSTFLILERPEDRALYFTDHLGALGGEVRSMPVWHLGEGVLSRMATAGGATLLDRSGNLLGAGARLLPAVSIPETASVPDPGRSAALAVTRRTRSMAVLSTIEGTVEIVSEGSVAFTTDPTRSHPKR